MCKDQDFALALICPEALTIAHPYLKEEQSALTNLLTTLKAAHRMSGCVVGGGNFQYLSTVQTYLESYILIEPVPSEHLPPNTMVFHQTFEDYSTLSVRKSENIVYIFWFNVVSYIDNFLEHINRIIKEGDVVFISTWATSNSSSNLKKRYSEYMSKKSYLQLRVPLLDQDFYEKIRFFKKLELIKQEFTHTFIIYT